MKNHPNRRQFITGAVGSAIAAQPILFRNAAAQGKVVRNSGTSIKLALNSYSFNAPLSAGEMDLFDVVDFCASQNLNALDATGYYFPGYPKVPGDDYIHALKKKAFLNGITINGTGVRNNFAVPDADQRSKDVQLVKDWIIVAQKLGAGIIRIFDGLNIPDGYTFEQVLEWMVPNIQECVEFGKAHGVMVGLQNHNGFAKTADQVIQIVNAVNSDWFGVKLDIGSLRVHDAYEEIAKLLPYAISWQLKEHVWFGDDEVPVDLSRIKKIIDRGGYRGFLPIETLGKGDLRVKVTTFLEKVRQYF